MWIDPPTPLDNLPELPGVYRYYDDNNSLLYIGKARNLRKRVSSYFQRMPEVLRTRALVQRIRSIEINIVGSEAEALVLEHNLIKEFKPRYNVLLKDSRSYPFLRLTGGHFPRLLVHHGARNAPGDYFGPYPDASALYATLNQMQRTFKLRQCPDTVFVNRSRPCLQHQINRCSAPCCGVISREAYHAEVTQARAFLLGEDDRLIEQWTTQMQQAATELRFEAAAELRDRIRRIRGMQATAPTTLPNDADGFAIIRHAGGIAVQIGTRRGGRDLGSRLLLADQATDAGDDEILLAAVSERYSQLRPPPLLLLHPEQANEELCSEIATLCQMAGGRADVFTPKRGEQHDWLLRLQAKAEQELAVTTPRNQQGAFAALAELFGLDAAPTLIAAVDNAHLGGKQMVAAIVYASPQGAEKSFYRHYNLIAAGEGDDYSAMSEVVGRFLRAIKEEALPQPDLLLVDGGRGQLAVALAELAKSEITGLKMVAVAKGEKRKFGEETLWPGWAADGSDLGQPQRPGKHHPALLLVGRLRDEAHRFANRHLRKRREQTVFKSALDEIPGIGKARRSQLLTHFGGIDGVRKASREQLASAPGISDGLAERIFAALHR